MSWVKVNKLKALNIPVYLRTRTDHLKNWRSLVQIELSISCRNLRDMGVTSKSYPTVLMYFGNQNEENWEEYGHTESIKNNLNPDFVEKFVVDYIFGEDQSLRFEVYDIDPTSTGLKKQNFLGLADCRLSQIVRARKGTFEMTLLGKSGNPDKDRGKIIIKSEEVNSSKDLIIMEWEGVDFDKKGTSHLFLEFWRADDSGFTICGQSELVKLDSNAKWHTYEIQAQKLCNGDPEREIKVKVVGWNKNGRHTIVGEFSTTLSLLERGPSESNTYKWFSGEEEAKKSVGKIKLTRFQKDVRPTFFEFIRSGINLNFVFTIDLGSSNGEKNDPNSYHYNHHFIPNQFMSTIQAVGEIIEEYTNNKNFSVYGCGACPPGSSEVNHKFPLNRNPEDPNCYGVEGILGAYKESLEKVKLSRPTHFSPIINHLHSTAANVKKAHNYYVLLVITDGVFSDFIPTREAIIKASNCPISIIFIGVGDGNFDKLVLLDGDRMPLAKGARDIVQFVRFEDHISKTTRHVLSKSRLVREILKEVPDQLTTFMTLHNIKPMEISSEDL